MKRFNLQILIRLVAAKPFNLNQSSSDLSGAHNVFTFYAGLKELGAT